MGRWPFPGFPRLGCVPCPSYGTSWLCLLSLRHQSSDAVLRGFLFPWPPSPHPRKGSWQPISRSVSPGENFPLVSPCSGSFAQAVHHRAAVNRRDGIASPCRGHNQLPVPGDGHFWHLGGGVGNRPRKGKTELLVASHSAGARSLRGDATPWPLSVLGSVGRGRAFHAGAFWRSHARGLGAGDTQGLLVTPLSL